MGYNQRTGDLLRPPEAERVYPISIACILPHSLSLCRPTIEEIQERYRRGEPVHPPILALFEGVFYSRQGDHRIFAKYRNASSMIDAEIFDWNSSKDRATLLELQRKKRIDEYAAKLAPLKAMGIGTLSKEEIEDSVPSFDHKSFAEEMRILPRFLAFHSIKGFVDLELRLRETKAEVDEEYYRLKSQYDHKDV